MNSRQRLIGKKKVRGNSLSALRRRNGRNPRQVLKTGAILDFCDEEVLKPLLRGPIADPYRHGDLLHVSDLIYKCARKIALAHRYNRPMHGNEVFDSQGLTFAIGNAMHDYVRNKIRDKHPEIMYGTWSCVCGETKHVGTRAEAAQTCPQCKGELHLYNELQIMHNELGVIGSIDLTLLVNAAFILTEIKSISKKQWDELVRPHPEHLTQILLYWYLAREQGYALHDRVSIIYAAKEWMFKNPYKEFVIQPSELMHRVQDYIEDASVLRAAMNNADRPLPARLSCPRDDSPAAKKCEMATICFEVDL